MTATVTRLAVARRARELADATWQPKTRGYVVAYHRGGLNACPGCGRSAWLVGRLSAECAFCGTALPIGREIAGRP